MTVTVGTSTSRRRRRRALAVVPFTATLVLLLSACIVNGTWVATPPGVQPVQGIPTAFADVSCVGQDWCMGVGAFNSYPLVEVWDGSGWSVVTAPPLAPEDNARVVSVDCGTPTSCLARVDRLPDGPEDFEYLVAWDGAQWHEVPPGITTEGPYLNPAPYSCAPDGTCVAVIQQWDVTVEWDGSQFTSTAYATTRPPFFNDVNALECLSATSCVAALSTGLGNWNGSTWSYGAGTGPAVVYPDLWLNGPSELACTSASDCLATGDGYIGNLVAGHWNGTTWTEFEDPAAHLAAGWTSVSDLSCASVGSCLALGVKNGSPATAAWSGSTWYDAPAPPVGTTGISCLPLWCMADGGTDGAGRPLPATYTWTNS